MGRVKIYLTGKLEGDKNIENFNNDFKDSKKALVFLMAEWCGHCKVVNGFLQPIYEKYDGKEFNGGNVVIGAFHENEYGQLNSNIDTNITGFPTIKQYTNGSNEEMANTLDRSTQEGIEKYIDMMIKQVKSVGQERPEEERSEEERSEEERSEEERSEEERPMKPKRKLRRRRTRCKKKKKKIQRQKTKLKKQKKKIDYLKNLLTRGRRRRKNKQSVKKSGTSKLKKRRTKSRYNKNESKRRRRSKSSIKNGKKNKLNFLKRLSSLIK
tara:strand:- start:60 stop:863 length:804 start_codon:yes stop_codon:yes gene_type:complete